MERVCCLAGHPLVLHQNSLNLQVQSLASPSMVLKPGEPLPVRVYDTERD